VEALLDRFSNVLVFGIGVPLILYVGWRMMLLVQMIHYLHLRRISPADLNARLNRDSQIVIIDLLGFEADDINVGIPGAIRIDPARLRRRSRVIMPNNLKIILYCSSVREITSARVALALRKKGIPEVWILEGGLKRWIKEGYPVTPNLTDSKDRMVEVGVQVLD
jgi:rhodanese-related sulfurtransferase